MPQNNGNKYTSEMIIETLRGYKDLKRKALQLEFEITHYIPLATGEDIIDAMTFGKPEGDDIGFIHKGSISDKTSIIAVSYAEKSARLNIRHKQELEAELRWTQTEILRIEYYLDLLDKKFSKALRKLYFEDKTIIDASKELGIGITTLKSHRKAGIDSLVEMFSLISL